MNYVGSNDNTMIDEIIINHNGIYTTLVNMIIYISMKVVINNHSQRYTYILCWFNDYIYTIGNVSN